MISILADEKIPYLKELLPKEVQWSTFSGDKLAAKALKKIDAVLVRSSTRIDIKALRRSSVKFVGSASAGMDHLPVDALNAAEIAWAYAPGCNAEAVAEYVENCLIALRDFHPTLDWTRIKNVGVIGVGHVGERVAQVLKKQNWKVRLYDPPRAERQRSFKSATLDAIAECDLICIHAALTREGVHPSYHLVNAEFLKKLKPGTIVLNAARGGLVDEPALLKYGKSLVLCWDTWEREPNIRQKLLARAFTATPHIAGYSEQGRWNASAQVVKQLCDFFNIHLQMPVFAGQNPCVHFPNVPHVLQTTKEMQNALLNVPSEEVSKIFQELRKNYVLR